MIHFVYFPKTISEVKGLLRRRLLSPGVRGVPTRVSSCIPAFDGWDGFLIWELKLLVFRYMMLYSSFSSWISQFLACMGSCIGCCVNSQPIIAVDEPSKGLRIHGQVMKKPCISDGFWSTSTYDMDSTLQSLRSYSSISVSNQILNSVSNQSEFVNPGLILWNQSRTQWLETEHSESQGKVTEPVLSWNANYESLLGTSKRFPQPVPLSEMVDFLVEIWDQESMYD